MVCGAGICGLDAPAGRSRRIDPAVIERKLGRELADKWDWSELDHTAPNRGGATKAERGALKLLAVFLQHRDSKAKNQRIVCVDDAADPKQPCAEPLIMINDLGITFGRAVGNLAGSWTGILKDPAISEEGRQEPNSGLPSIDEWVDAFKQKRTQIVEHRCAASVRGNRRAAGSIRRASLRSGAGAAT